MRRHLAVHALAGLALAAGAGAASGAEGPAPQPAVHVTNVATDPTHFGWISDDGRKALSTAIASHAGGMLYAFVFTAAPGGNFWNYESATQQTDFVSISDLARRSLETCEYFSNSPCYVVSVNGLDARDAAGGLEQQPYMLASQPTEFDPTRVPFVNATSWPQLRGYLTLTKAKALVVTYNGDWWWDTGSTVAGAVAAATADCQKASANNVCALYAVNNRVVFTANGPH